MRNVLLTDHVKTKLVDNIVYQWIINNPQPNVNLASFNLAHRALRKNYADAYENVLEMFNNDPIKGKFIHLEQEITVQVNETKEIVALQWDKSNNNTPALPVPMLHNKNVPLYITKEFDEWQQYQSVITKLNNWMNKKQLLIDQVDHVVYSFETSAQLYDSWPEFEPFFDEYVLKGISNFPKKVKK